MQLRLMSAESLDLNEAGVAAFVGQCGLDTAAIKAA
jgi:hypothetical protein